MDAAVNAAGIQTAQTGAEAWGRQQVAACRAGILPEAQQGMTVCAGDKQVAHPAIPDIPPMTARKRRTEIERRPPDFMSTLYAPYLRM